MATIAVLEVGYDGVRLRSGGRGRRVLAQHLPHQPGTRPFLKWAGGKQWLVPLAHVLLPDRLEGRYFEAFLGGGALFFALRPARALLSDSNADLIACYETLRSHPDAVVELLRSYPHDREFYDDLRNNAPNSPVARAARLIYLNKTAFNGLYRVSRTGRFNVPFGRYPNPTICNEPRLRSAASALSTAELQHLDFSDALARARKGDFVYCDPPYITTHRNNGFLKYNAHLFSWADQLRLADQVHGLHSRGVKVVVSNADHSDVRALYSGLYGFQVARRSAISGATDYRGRVRELLVTNFPLFNTDTPSLP